MLTEWQIVAEWEFSRSRDKTIISFARAIEALTLEQTIEKCAKVCDGEADLMNKTGLTYPEDSHGRDRCFARARTAAACAEELRALGSKE